MWLDAPMEGAAIDHLFGSGFFRPGGNQLPGLASLALLDVVTVTAGARFVRFGALGDGVFQILDLGLECQNLGIFGIAGSVFA